MMDEKSANVEFKRLEDYGAWEKVVNLPEGAEEIVIYRDDIQGTYCRFLRLQKGFTGAEKPMVHDFDEVVYIISGSMYNRLTGQSYNQGEVAVFPKGVEHGPFVPPEGGIYLEFRHYKK